MFRKILFNLNGEQQLVTVGEGGSVTTDAEILWDEAIDGPMPEIVLGNMARVFNALVKLDDPFDSHVAAVMAKNAEQEKRDALRYLAATDWYLIRETDSGVECPQSIREARAAARLKIN